MDPEERKLRIHEIRVEILLQVGTDLAQTIRFSSRSIYPMLEDTRALRVVMERERLDVDRLLFDDSEETELERCRGSWRPAVSALTGGAGARPGLDEAASLFERHVLPMQRVAKTRGRYWSAWIGTVTRGAGSDPTNDSEGVPCISLRCFVVPMHSTCGQALHSCHPSASSTL